MKYLTISDFYFGESQIRQIRPISPTSQTFPLGMWYETNKKACVILGGRNNKLKV